MRSTKIVLIFTAVNREVVSVLSRRKASVLHRKRNFIDNVKGCDADYF